MAWGELISLLFGVGRVWGEFCKFPEEARYTSYLLWGESPVWAYIIYISTAGNPPQTPRTGLCEFGDWFRGVLRVAGPPAPPGCAAFALNSPNRHSRANIFIEGGRGEQGGEGRVSMFSEVMFFS